MQGIIILHLLTIKGFSDLYVAIFKGSSLLLTYFWAFIWTSGFQTEAFYLYNRMENYNFVIHIKITI